jgi:hypothetical protein
LPPLDAPAGALRGDDAPRSLRHARPARRRLGASSRLAAAYGIAVTGTMPVTSIRSSGAILGLPGGTMGAVEESFFARDTTKVGLVIHARFP